METEDEPTLLRLNAEFLRSLGYDILEAANGMEALDLSTTYPEHIELLATDLAMPGLGGLELPEQLARIRPDVKVLFVSGYSDEEVQEKVSASGATFL